MPNRRLAEPTLAAVRPPTPKRPDPGPSAIADPGPDVKVDSTLPPDILDPETGELDPVRLLDAYERVSARLDAILSGQPMDEDRALLQSAFGVPDSPDAYQPDLTRHGPLEADPETNARLHAAGFSAEQVQLVYDLAAEKLGPLLDQDAEDSLSERELEKLIEAFGGEEKWEETARQLAAWAEKHLPPAVIEAMAGSYEGVMALYQMMRGEGPAFLGKSETDPNLSEDDLHALMRDPKYWRDKDPRHIKRVSRGFQRLYGG